jgi:hypothetical protein
MPVLPIGPLENSLNERGLNHLAVISPEEINANLDLLLQYSSDFHAIAETSRLYKKLKELEGA